MKIFTADNMVTVVKVDLDIARLDGSAVDEEKEAFNGSITKLVEPGGGPANLWMSLRQ